MLRFALVVFASVFVVGAALADSDWRTDYKKAQEEAKQSNRLLLVDFTGSDWCGYCILLDREILSRPEFKDYAKKNLVLLEIDFPRTKPLPVETRKQNQELAQQYQIEGFPTIVVLDGDGKTIWRYDGYFSNGPGAFIAELEKLRKG
ncbi:MAG TPA: thioredoxin family protein [Chthoniobacterales bacterium]|nr:thioredoxin family protein [Chthoniobacterales bacterium]